MAGLTPKQLIFCKEYLIDMNATRASIEAGYSKHSADSQGSRMLKNVKVKAYIDKHSRKRLEKLDITADKVMQELANIAFFDPRKMFNENSGLIEIQDLDDATAKAIGTIKLRKEKMDSDTFAETMEVKPNDKLKALDMIMKNMGMYEKDNEQSKDEVTIVEII